MQTPNAAIDSCTWKYLTINRFVEIPACEKFRDNDFPNKKSTTKKIMTYWRGFGGTKGDLEIIYNKKNKDLEMKINHKPLYGATVEMSQSYGDSQFLLTLIHPDLGTLYFLGVRKNE